MGWQDAYDQNWSQVIQGMDNYGNSVVKPTRTIAYNSDDQIVTAFDSGPALVSPASGNIPSVEHTAAAFLPGNGVFSPNQFSTGNSQVTVTVPTVPVSAAPAAAQTSSKLPIVLIVAAVGAYYFMKRKKK